MGSATRSRGLKSGGIGLGWAGLAWAGGCVAPQQSWKQLRGGALLARCDQWGMLGEGWRQGTAVLAHTRFQPFGLHGVKWASSRHLCRQAVHIGHQGVCTPGSPRLSPLLPVFTQLLSPPVHCFTSDSESLSFSASMLGPSLLLSDCVVSCQPHVSSGPYFRSLPGLPAGSQEKRGHCCRVAL